MMRARQDGWQHASQNKMLAIPLSCFATERPHLDVDARWDAINLSYAAPLSNWR
jgi:hypothetical protein